jgi:hypothetical protein
MYVIILGNHLGEISNKFSPIDKDYFCCPRILSHNVFQNSCHSVCFLKISNQFVPRSIMVTYHIAINFYFFFLLCMYHHFYTEYFPGFACSFFFWLANFSVDIRHIWNSEFLNLLKLFSISRVDK